MRKIPHFYLSILVVVAGIYKRTYLRLAFSTKFPKRKRTDHEDLSLLLVRLLVVIPEQPAFP